jgi:hypothetical protein
MTPADWNVEALGLANTVVFSGPHGRILRWTDGAWHLGSEHGQLPISSDAVGRASTMDQARTVGAAFIVEFERREQEADSFGPGYPPDHRHAPDCKGSCCT